MFYINFFFFILLISKQRELLTPPGRQATFYEVFWQKTQIIVFIGDIIMN